MSPDDKKMKIRELIYKWLFLAGDRFKSFEKWFSGVCRFCFSVTLLLFFFAFLFYIGFTNSEETILRLRSAFRILFLILFISKFLPEILHFKKKTDISFVFVIIVFLFSFGVFLSNFNIVTSNKSFWTFFFGNIKIVIAIFLIAISEISVLAR
ncbi:MAG: hypothetical protein WC854_11405, partial [Bacteroidales bacterium]